MRIDDAHPHSHNPVKFATTLMIVAANSPSPMKSFGNTLLALVAIVMIPAAVKALGPTETNIPGLRFSFGSFCVIRR